MAKATRSARFYTGSDSDINSSREDREKRRERYAADARKRKEIAERERKKREKAKKKREERLKELGEHSKQTKPKKKKTKRGWNGKYKPDAEVVTYVRDVNGNMVKVEKSKPKMEATVEVENAQLVERIRKLEEDGLDVTTTSLGFVVGTAVLDSRLGAGIVTALSDDSLTMSFKGEKVETGFPACVLDGNITIAGVLDVDGCYTN